MRLSSLFNARGAPPPRVTALRRSSCWAAGADSLSSRGPQALVSLFAVSAGSNMRALPENRGADAYQRRAFLDGDLEVVAHPHGQLAHHRAVHAACQQAIAHVAQRTEIWPCAFGVIS